jgi:hypothetical protein
MKWIGNWKNTVYNAAVRKEDGHDNPEEYTTEIEWTSKKPSHPCRT